MYDREAAETRQRMDYGTELHQSYATRCELHPWNQKIRVSWDMILERRVGRSSREIERMRGLRFEWAGCRGDV